MDITISDFMKGMYNLLIYVGIDIVKLNHFASVISSDGVELMRPFKFTNDVNGFQMLQSRLKKFSHSGDSSIISLKSMAHYDNNLVRYLVAFNYNVCVELLQNIRHAQRYIRKTKTDKVDTFIIVQTLMMKNSYKFVSFYDLELMDFKQLRRFHQKNIKQRTRLKIQPTSYVNQVFPKLQYFFKSGLHPKAVYALLKKTPMPQDIASMHICPIFLTCL